MAKRINEYILKDMLGIMLLVCADILSVFTATWFSWALTSRLIGIPYQLAVNMQLLLLTVIITVTNLYFFDLYYASKDFRRFHQFINLIAASSSSFLMLVMLIFLSNSLLIGRRFVIIYICLMFLLILVSRTIFSIFHKIYLRKTAIVIGDTAIGRILLKLINSRDGYESGQDIKVIGYISEEKAEDNATYRSVPYLGPIDKADRVVNINKAQLAIYALHQSGGASFNELLIREKLKGMDLISAAGLYEAISGKIPYEHVGSDYLIEDCLRGQKFILARIKFIFDIILGSVLLVLAIPILAICAIGIKLDSRGPVLFVQKRVGKLGKSFKVYKFRTMKGTVVHGKVKRNGWNDLYKENEGRITRFGKFLRKTHMDELPQLFNVLLGDMSIVGPRPEMELYVTRCEKHVPLYRLRLAVRPGITGWAQVSYVHTSTLSGYRRKLEYDLYYLKNMSFRLDLEILIRTFFLLLGYREKRGPESVGDLSGNI